MGSYLTVLPVNRVMALSAIQSGHFTDPQLHLLADELLDSLQHIDPDGYERPQSVVSTFQLFLKRRELASKAGDDFGKELASFLRTTIGRSGWEALKHGKVGLFVTTGEAKKRFSETLKVSPDLFRSETTPWSPLVSPVPYPARSESGFVSLPYVFDALQNPHVTIQLSKNTYTHLDFESGKGEYAKILTERNPAWQIVAIDDGGLSLQLLTNDGQLITGESGRFTPERFTRHIQNIFNKEIWEHPLGNTKEETQGQILETIRAIKQDIGTNGDAYFYAGLTDWEERLGGKGWLGMDSHHGLVAKIVNLAVIYSLSLDGSDPPLPINAGLSPEEFLESYLSNSGSYWALHADSLRRDFHFDEIIGGKAWNATIGYLKKLGIESGLLPGEEQHIKYRELHLQRRRELFGDASFPNLTPHQMAQLLINGLLYFHFRHYATGGHVPQNLTVVRGPTANETGFSFVGISLPSSSVDSISWMCPFRHNDDIHGIATEMARILKRDWKFIDVGIYQGIPERDFTEASLKKLAQTVGAKEIKEIGSSDIPYKSVLHKKEEVKFYRILGPLFGDLPKK